MSSRIVGHGLEQFEIALRLVLTPDPSRCLGGAIDGASEIWIQLHRSLEPAHRILVLSSLGIALTRVVRREGILGIGIGDQPETLVGSVYIAHVARQDGGDVERPEVVRLHLKDTLENVHGTVLIVRPLPVQLGDRQIDSKLRMLGVSLHELVEHLPGTVIVETPHKAHTTIVGFYEFIRIERPPITRARWRITTTSNEEGKEQTHRHCLHELHYQLLRDFLIRSIRETLSIGWVSLGGIPPWT